jgi:hypothetical protein
MNGVRADPASASGVRACRAVLAALAVAGCATGVKNYPNTLDKNVQIRSETVSSSSLFQVRTAVGVYRVGERCELEFEGVVNIDRPTVAMGIPANRWTYLDFTFNGSSPDGSSGGAVSRETLFRARAGYRYDVAVTYRKDTYHVAIREIPPKGGAGREVEFRDIRACRPPWRATTR